MTGRAGSAAIFNRAELLVDADRRHTRFLFKLAQRGDLWLFMTINRAFRYLDAIKRMLKLSGDVVKNQQCMAAPLRAHNARKGFVLRDQHGDDTAAAALT